MYVWIYVHTAFQEFGVILKCRFFHENVHESWILNEILDEFEDEQLSSKINTKYSNWQSCK